MKQGLFVLMCAVAFCMGCSDEGNDGGSKELELGKEISTEQILHADENGENNGIRFTAAADWTATVTEVPTVRSEAVGRVAWLTLSAYSGGAGEHTLTMGIEENRTGKTRKAEIVIRCGETKITVTVEQTAEKEDGTVVKPVRTIIYREELNSNKVTLNTDYSENFDKTFAYDEQGRVVRIETQYTHDGETWTVTHGFDYGVVGEIGISCVDNRYGSSDTEYYRAKLDARGNVVALQEKEEGRYEDYIAFQYTADGRLAQCKDFDEYGAEGNFSYVDGSLAKYEYVSFEYEEENTVYEFPSATTYPNKYLNYGAIDFLGYIMMDDDYDFLFHIGRLGKSGDYLPERFPGGEQGLSAEYISGYYTPGEVIHKIKQYIVWPENKDAVLTYEFDNDKNMTKMVITESFVVMEDEYDIVVGTELLYPERPELGYAYDIKNRTTRKVRDWNDVYTYTVVY